MNLQKLFEIQAELDCHINKEHPVQEGEDRLAKRFSRRKLNLENYVIVGVGLSFGVINKNR